MQPVAERGGSDLALLRTVRSLPRDGFECHVAMPAVGPLTPDFAAAGATVHVVTMRRITTSGGIGWWIRYLAAWPLAVLRLARLVWSTRADLVCSNSLHTWYGWAAALLTRRPHVWHAREIVVQSGLALRLERFLCRRFATRVVAISEAVADQLDRANVVVVRDEPDPGEFGPQASGRFRREQAIADDALLVGSAGRIDTWKGFDVVLDAYERLKRIRPDLRLAVAGPPVAGKEDYAAELAGQAADLGALWLGHYGDMAALYADLDVFVSASTEPEPYGLVIVEALLCGTPVVATDRGGPPEILASAGSDAGLLVPPGSPADLARAIFDLLPDATSTEARRARPRLWRPGPNRTAAVYREVLGRSSP